MKRFIEGERRTQVTLLPECLDDYVAEENPVRVVDVFVDELDLTQMHAQWPRAAEAPERLATTYKQLSTTNTI